MRRMKRAMTVLGLAALGLAGGAGAWAANASDSLTVTITPNAFYAVSITTTNAVLNLGLVNLGVSTWTVSPATVTILSSFAQTGLTLQGAITAASNPWSFSTDSTTLQTDKLAAWAVFTDTSVNTSPSQSSGYFNGTTQANNTDMFDTTVRPVGVTGGGGSEFIANPGDLGYKQMEFLPTNTVDPNGSRSFLWLRFRLPGGTTGTSAQNITVTLTAGAPQ